jgi:uncharacterized protein (DUF302 family)
MIGASERRKVMSFQQDDAVTYARLGKAAADFQKSITISLPIDAAVEALRGAIQRFDLWVLHEIDPQALLARGGFAIRPARQILFFHPRYMVRILACDPAAVLEAPLKIALIDTPDAGVMVRWPDPQRAFSRYGSAPLAALGRELAVLCDEMVAAAFSGGG